MKSGIVRSIKRYHHIEVANALYALGYRWMQPHRKPTNVERMVACLSRSQLLAVLHALPRR